MAAGPSESALERINQSPFARRTVAFAKVDENVTGICRTWRTAGAAAFDLSVPSAQQVSDSNVCALQQVVAQASSK